MPRDYYSSTSHCGCCPGIFFLELWNHESSSLLTKLYSSTRSRNSSHEKDKTQPWRMEDMQSRTQISRTKPVSDLLARQPAKKEVSTLHFHRLRCFDRSSWRVIFTLTPLNHALQRTRPSRGAEYDRHRLVH